MEKIAAIEKLKASILLLELQQAREEVLLKEQFKITFESLQPANLIKNTFRDLTEAPDFKGNLLNTGLSMAAGYLSKKIVVGETHNPIKQILGSLLQVGITSLVSKNSVGITSAIVQAISSFSNKKETAA